MEAELLRTELEIQNLELRTSRQLLSETLDLYASLYDFAAVACLTFDDQGKIREINLTGSRLLKEHRDRLIGFPFARFLDADSVPVFFSHLKRMKDGQSRRVAQLRLSLKGHPPLWVTLVSSRAAGDSDLRLPDGIQSALIEQT